jgi:ATP-dependent Clp protease ATP-binding subunit ClpC
MEKYLHLEDSLMAKVIGQEKAIKVVSEAIKRGRAGLSDPNKPLGSFLFLGSTGVGKTELAKALTEELFNDRDAMIRLDMSEYMEKHSVAKLIGSPPGYVGYGEGGQLTEKVRRRPYSVILLDEIEKAHPDVFNILLQVLDDGRLTDAQGRLIDFKNTVIIATSNIGATKIQEHFKSQTEIDKTLKDQLDYELSLVFRPEFLNRLEDIVIFNPLTEADITQIFDLLFTKTVNRLGLLEIHLSISEPFKKKVISEGFSPIFGARPLQREIQKQIENPLASEILKGKFKPGDIVEIKQKKGATIFEKKNNKS